jgi:DNA uptake protein ComE-like DNA-binding protein
MAPRDFSRHSSFCVHHAAFIPHPSSLIRHPSRRRGFVLILVVIVIALLTLVCFTFSEMMLGERKAAVVGGRQAQALAAADSGVQLARIFLLKTQDVQNQAGGWYDNSTQFCALTVVDNVNPSARIKVTIISPLEVNGIPGGGIRYGLENESAKFNINNVLSFEKSSSKSSSTKTGSSGSGSTSTSGGTGTGTSGGTSTGSSGGTGAGTSAGTTGGTTGTTGTGSTSGSSTTSSSSSTSTSSGGAGGEAVLMNLPGVTQDVADCILDWIDTNDQAREFGAETEYYSNLNPPYLPKNGPLSTIDELLLVKGVTPSLLYGSDINRNGRVDTDEPTNLNQPNVDNTDGSMSTGWSSCLTLYSKEKNVQSNGQAKIDLNSGDLQTLSTDLQNAQITDEQIQFILAYRVYGPATSTSSSQQTSGSGSKTSSQSRSSGGSGSSGSGATVSELITKAATAQLTSVVELIGAKVQITNQTSQGGQAGGSQSQSSTTMQSPFTDSTGDMSSYLPTLMDACTVDSSQEIVGRVNINLAPKAVLMTVPNFTSEIADQIIAQRTMDPKSLDAAHKFATWLLSDGIVTVEQWKKWNLDKYITCGGDVYRVQAIGFFDDGGVAARIEAILDASTQPPTVLFWRDMSHLGRGFTLEELGSTSTSTTTR